jgi:two-component system, oxyanion-binding sensor
MNSALSKGPPHLLKVGFMPLLDSAVLVAAAERGFAAEEGIELALVRETSWANIRDRVIIGHFDAAHLLGPMAVASTLGIGHVRVPFIAPCALGIGGNAITVSTGLWEQMSAAGAVAGGPPAAQGAALRYAVAARQRVRGEPLTFGIVYPFSCHNYELRYWLAAAGIHPDRDVRLVVIPPPFLADALHAGEIDGFCVGEPWNSVAVEAGVGVIALATTAIWPLSPEKVLGLRQDWALEHPRPLAALVRAIYRAAYWCERPENHAELARLLAEPRFVGAPAPLLRRALANRLVLIPGQPDQYVEGFFATARDEATFPWTSHALWFHAQMMRWGQLPYTESDVGAVIATYRPDLYRQALEPLGAKLPAHDSRTDRFFDGEVFEPRAHPAYRHHLRS